MKRLLLASGFILTSLSAVTAQTAENILQNLSNHISKIKGATANFSYTTKDRNNVIRGSVKGNIAFKGNKFYLKQGKNEIFSNGTILWNYNGSNEVSITSASENEGTITPQKLLSGNMAKDFNSKLVTTDNKKYTIELTPKDKRKNFNKVLLFISKKNNMVTEATVFEKSGNTIQFSLSNINTAVNLPDSKFVFDIKKYPKVEVIN